MAGSAGQFSHPLGTVWEGTGAINRTSGRKRGMMSTPLFILPDSALAIIGLKEMGKFLWEGREKAGRREGQG